MKDKSKVLVSGDIIPFGKYKGELIDDICNSDPEYVLWLTEKSDHVVCGSLIIWIDQMLIEDWIDNLPSDMD